MDCTLCCVRVTNEENAVSLKKGITVILGANILNLLFNLLTNFFLPKYLTLDCYAEIKTFQLYVSYSGVLHLGYVDGMYIKYGGHLLSDIDRDDLQTDFFTLVIFQFALLGIFLIAALCYRNMVLVSCILAFFPLNITGYYRQLFQATGEFSAYARNTNFATILTFAANMGLLLFHVFSNHYLYLAAYIAIDIVVMLSCIVLMNRRSSQFVHHLKMKFSCSYLVKNITSGIFLMLGNFSSMILTGMDRWFIKALMDNTAFAMYSFAVSMENMMNVAVTPISTTLYNYFCSHKKEEELRNIKGIIILFAAAIVACAFPAKFILETFLTKYLDSTGVIFYLFGAQIFYIIVKCFYVNLYKAQKRQKEYFVKLIAVIVIGFIFNAGFYAILHTKEAFAIGTMLCGVTWYILSELDFKALRSNWNENLFLLLATLSYLFLGAISEALIGLVLYAMLLVLLSFVLMREDIMECWKMVKGFLAR